MLIGLETVLKSDAPFYIRYNNTKPSLSHDKNFEIGKAEVISEGTHVAILVYGFLLGEAVNAKEILEAHGKSVRLINLRTVKPIDEDAILKAAKECKMILTLEDHFLTGGLYSIIAEIFLRKQITAKVIPVAMDNKWFKPVLGQDLLEYEGFTGKQIAEKVLKNL